MADAPTKTVPVIQQIRTMKWNFWIANIIEAMERLCFWGTRAVLPIYMVAEESPIDLSMTQKSWIYGIWAFFQCFIPMVSGGYTETYGYKKSMFVAFALNIGGFCLMANATGFWSMLCAACLVGCGTAIFKPPVQGAVARSLNDGNSSLGFGIFYWMVNIGAFIGPLVAATVRGDPEHDPTWEYVFYGAALVTALNYLPAIFLFREPEADPEARKKKPIKVFLETMKTLWDDKQMLRFLLVISGFWFMFMQLWDTLPNFIDQWVDTRDVGALLPNIDPLLSWLPWMEEGWSNEFCYGDGRAKQELMINIDAFSIVILVIPLSWLFGRYLSKMTCLLLGMAVSVVGFTAAGMSTVGYFVGVMIFIFSIGEIMFSPKFSEYVGMTAPPDKKAVYMGYINIPWAIGWGVGNLFTGPLYDWLSSKTNLAQKYLVDKLGVAKTFVTGEEAFPTKYTSEVMAAKMNGASMDRIMEAVRNEDSQALSELAGDLTKFDVMQVLWETYHPWTIWIVLGVIGTASLVWMWIIYVKTRRAKTPPPVPETG